MSIVIDGTPAINDLRAIRRYCHHLIQGLAELESNLEFSLLYLGCKKNTPLPPVHNPRFREVKSAIPGRLLKPSWAWFNYPALSFWIKERPDLLHFPGGNPYIPNSCKTVLTTLHGFFPKMYPQYMPETERKAALTGLDFSINHSTDFITVSETNKQELVKLWGVAADRITAISLGISPEFREDDLAPELKASLLKKYALPEERFMLFVGALEPHKNIDGIISAYAAMGPRWHRAVKLVLVGAETGYCRTYREQIRTLGISDSVFFVNYIPPGSTDLAHLYNLAELFVFPSFYEGWASPPLEAMSCGTPAVVADIPSLRESTGGAAWYCDPARPEDIAEKITHALEDRTAYDKIRRQGSEFASRQTWRNCAEKTLKLYERLG